MKIKGFLKDVTGAMRVTNARRKIIADASGDNLYSDPIRELCRELHPEATHVRVARVEDASPTARTYTFEPVGGDVLPPFQAGQYVSFDLQIGETITTRPFSISSAPYLARTGEAPFFQITVRTARPGGGFVAPWFYENVKAGDEFTCHMPYGFFFYEPLRDAKRVVALAGGSGITPFASMAAEIAHGTLDCDLTLPYGSVSPDDVILGGKLAEIAAGCDRVKMVNVFSGKDVELPEGAEAGFITADLIAKYTEGAPSDGGTSYFVCGPLAMYDFVSGELDKLGVPFRRVRMEVFGAPRDVYKAEGYPADFEPRTLSLTVRRGLDEQVIPAASTEPLAVAMERAGIKNRTRCRSGACGYCRCYVAEGEFFVPAVGDGRRFSDKQYGYVHACSTYPLTDMVIEVPII